MNSAVSRRSIPSLDGMRGIAVLLVIAAHVNLFGKLVAVFERHHLPLLAGLFRIDPGDLGVSIFFVMSGYLITTLLLRETGPESAHRLASFYLRRFFRIFPPYYVYLIVVLCLRALHQVPLARGGFLSAVAYVSNVYPYTRSHPESVGWLTGHTWSLSLEEQFYLFWPVWLRSAGTRGALATGLVICLLSPVSRLLTLAYHPAFAFDEQIVRMFHTRMDTIMFGCVLALLASRPRTARVLTRIAGNHCLAALAGLLLLADLLLSAAQPRFNLSFGLTSEGFLLALLTIYFVENAASFTGRLLNNPALVHIGLISYSLYLWQQLFVGPFPVFRSRYGAWLLATFACAELSYFLVERQSTRLGNRLLTRLNLR